MRKGVSVRNSIGYVDSTAHDALNNVIDEMSRCSESDTDARNNRMIKAIRQIIDLAGFELIGRIAVRDKATGKIYR